MDMVEGHTWHNGTTFIATSLLKMSDSIINFITNPSFGTGIVVGILAMLCMVQYLGKIWSNRILTHEKHSLDLKLQEFTSELGRKAIESQIVFQQLHTDRSKVLVEFYRRLRALMNTRGLLSPGPILDEEGPTLQRITESFGPLRDYFMDHRLYFPESFCEKIDSILTSFSRVIDVRLDLGVIPPGPGVDLRNERRELILQAKHIVREEIPALRREIEKDFRVLIGIENQ